ncbi:MAG: hypothetical protein IT270_12675 [Saprospiraceae bacterium]|nr:hypothetical protein [Saprospiraceae bacterium]
MYPRIVISIILSLSGLWLTAQNEWPREIPYKDNGRIIIFQPQPESLVGNKLKSRAAISIREKTESEPIYGVVWTECITETNRDTRMMTLESIKVTDTRFPDSPAVKDLANFKKFIETEAPTWGLEISLDQLLTELENSTATKAENLNTAPPKIYYTEKPTTLIIIDGEPRTKYDEDMKLDRVMNSPYLILEEKDQYYLYAGGLWYTSTEVKKGWRHTDKLPKKVKKVDKKIKENEKEIDASADVKPGKPTDIIVTTEPAELLSTSGPATYANVEGTNLLFVVNSESQIFKAVESQDNFILLSGRWYKSFGLDGPWTYVSADKLPADFAKIPEGSEKDIVLASVAGTKAAEEAVRDAQLPQTAKVDRKSAKASVTYDGDPKFEPIKGTNIELAVNASTTVMRDGNQYYLVDNGVWFVSNSAKGPWQVSEDRPDQVDQIPPESSAYNTRYVYVYESTPEYVYVGYTPGYLGNYVYGPTIVYGTGYYYQPWYGAYYYPQPWSYGFGMYYNPYMGWGMSMTYAYHVGWGGYYGGYYGHYGGWYGPPMYHPPYHPHYPPGGGGGYYGPRPGGGTGVNNNPRVEHYNDGRQTNNIYNNRKDVSTRDRVPSAESGRPSTRPGSTKPNQQPSTRPSTERPSTQPSTRPSTERPSTQPATRPSTQPSTRPSTQPATRENNVMTDKSGKMYQRDKNGTWNERNNNTWQPSQNTRQMDQMQQSRDRGNYRTQQSQQRAAPTRSAAPRGGGGRRG